jgi:hypothetical protein
MSNLWGLPPCLNLLIEIKIKENLKNLLNKKMKNPEAKIILSKHHPHTHNP